MAPQTVTTAVPRQPVRTDVVVCASCHASVPVAEVFDAWEVGFNRDLCPRCQGVLLAVVTLP